MIEIRKSKRNQLLQATLLLKTKYAHHLTDNVCDASIQIPDTLLITLFVFLAQWRVNRP